MKLKLNQTRTYDNAGFRRRAACLCFKAECELEVLLVTSSRYNHMWVVPGGGLEPGEDPATTAVREVHEEAGVVGKLGRFLDVFENKDRMTRTYVYTLVVENLSDEYEDRKEIGRLRQWFSLEEAIAKLREHKPVQLKYIEKLCADQDHRQKSMICLQSCNHEKKPLDEVPSAICLTCKSSIYPATCSCHVQSMDVLSSESRERLRVDKINLNRTASPRRDIKASLWVVDANTHSTNSLQTQKHHMVSTT